MHYAKNSYTYGIVNVSIPNFSGICYRCEFSTVAYSKVDEDCFIGERLSKFFDRAVIKRKSEFIAGRYLAKKALLALSSSYTSVGIGANRAPVWPKNFVGSITHCNGTAICAVAHKSALRIIGIDLEMIVNDTLAKEIVGSVLNISEYHLVGSYSSPDPLALTVVFSAKESLFKALYPEVKHYFDFTSAEMEWLDFQAGRFRLKLIDELSPVLPIGTCFEGGFKLEGRSVFTFILGYD